MWKRAILITGLVFLPGQTSCGYQTKLLHLRRGKELFKLINSNESTQPLKCLLKWYFFKNLLTISCKSIFYVSAVNIYCSDIFEGFSCRFFGFLFKIYFKNIYFDTGSNYLYMNFLFRVFPILVLHI